MGREIVSQESPEQPGKRSRLWFQEDIVQVLEENTGTSRIQIIILDSFKVEVHWDGKAFKKMKNLKTLIIRNVCFSKGPEHLPNSLRVLEWQGYPSTSLPSEFYPKKPVILDLPRSCLMSLELFMSKKKFVNLTVLNFDLCQYITEIPDVSVVTKLEKLSLRGCEKLIKIHESFGFLAKLLILDASYCNELSTFPPMKLTSLEQLERSYFILLKTFPEILGKMEAITEVYFQDTGIKELPFSIHYLTRLRRLEVRSCGMLYLPSSIVTLPELELLSVSAPEGLQSSEEDNGEEKVCSIYSSNLGFLDLIGCSISDEFLRKGLTWFANVKYLNLTANTFMILPACIKECRHLEVLNLNYCKLLQQIKGIPPMLGKVTAKGCKSLNGLDLRLLPACTKECHFLWELILDDCENLQEITGVPLNIEILSAKNCKSLTSLCRSMLLNQELHERAGCKLILQATRIPGWFEHCSSGPSISFWFRNKFPSMSLCLVLGQRNHHPFFPIRFQLKLINGKSFLIDTMELSPSDHVYIFDISHKWCG